MTEICLTFAPEAQREAPLRQAAYRMAGIAGCQIDFVAGHWSCRLTAPPREDLAVDVLRQRFLAILNDENLREQIEERTSKLRDVIVALAFGALVTDYKTGT